jgi:hypothetical protein
MLVVAQDTTHAGLAESNEGAKLDGAAHYHNPDRRVRPIKR